jgi:divalent metal cation (Fe/Co/Zn/Cd) transporter
MGFSYWDFHHVGPIVAIIETAHILIIGTEIFKDSVYGLLDASISQQEVKDIKTTLGKIPGVCNVNYVKSRKVGQKVWLNIKFETLSSNSIKQVDSLKKEINDRVRQKINNIEEIMLNVVPFRNEETEEDSEVAVVS